MRNTVSAAILGSLLSVSCGSSSPLEGKSWSPLPTVDIQFISGLGFDAQERLLLHDFVGQHTFRFDPAIGLWDDLGAKGVPQDSGISVDSLGTVYLAVNHPPQLNQLRTATLYRLDDRTWTQLYDFEGGFDYRLGKGEYFGYRREIDTTTVKRYVGGQWTITATLPGLYRVNVDDAGTQLMQADGNDPSIFRLSSDGTAVVPLITCGTTVQYPYCKGGRFAHMSSDGKFYFIGDNKSNVPVVYVVPAGSSVPEELVGMPATDVEAPVPFGLSFDTGGNAYLRYGSNNAGDIGLYYLSAGDTVWQRVITWNTPSNAMRVSPSGTVYSLSSGQGPDYVLK
jgi:hypothetical protein